MTLVQIPGSNPLSGANRFQAEPLLLYDNTMLLGGYFPSDPIDLLADSVEINGDASTETVLEDGNCDADSTAPATGSGDVSGFVVYLDGEYEVLGVRIELSSGSKCNSRAVAPGNGRGARGAPKIFLSPPVFPRKHK